MFPLVQILHSQGYEISGSDNNESDILNLERQMGLQIHLGHSPENLAGADMVMYTAAILADNPELAAARKMGIPMLERAEVLGAVSSRYQNAVGVTGTHGKTTVTSMLTHILYLAGKDPSAVIGGKLSTIGGYGRAGKTDLFVYEACEFQDHFLRTCPDVAIILNIDNDHMEYFGTVENAMKSYTAFANMAGRVLYNGDDANTCTAMEPVEKEKYTFGMSPERDFYPADVVRQDGFTCSFDLMHRGEKLTRLTLHIPGDHNILNAVAAAAEAWMQGVAPDEIARAMESFHGAGRRFELVGRVDGVTIADDYGHHPAELTATLKAAMNLGYRQVWAVFQPFTFSRTYLLLDDFVKALSLADHVVLSSIMGSREVNTYNIHSSDLGEKIPGCAWRDTFEEVAEYVMSRVQPGDLVLTMGCGDIYKCARMMLHMGRLKDQEQAEAVH